MDKLYTKSRKIKRQKFYSSRAWRKRSLLQRKHKPLCEMCEKRGVYRLAQVADHIDPLWTTARQGLTAKLQSLCVQCHKAKTIDIDLPKMALAEKTALKFF